VKALDRSIAEIATAIDKGDVAFLKTLPGIGQQRAKDIVAKLQGKVSRFGLIQDRAVADRPEAAPAPAFREEALQVLLQLQYKKAEAEGMITRALERNGTIGSIEELLNEIYKQRIVR
jgi:Holliday junction resolvasome RuvABC DNA-binding subunit